MFSQGRPGSNLRSGVIFSSIKRTRLSQVSLAGGLAGEARIFALIRSDAKEREHARARLPSPFVQQVVLAETKGPTQNVVHNPGE